MTRKFATLARGLYAGGALACAAACAPTEPTSPTETGPAEDSTSEGSVTDSAPLPVQPQTLAIEGCDEDGFIMPLPGEERNWAGVVLESPIEGVLQEVRYVLNDATARYVAAGVFDCDASLPHTVAVWTQSGVTPSGSPPSYVALPRPGTEPVEPGQYPQSVPVGHLGIHVGAGERVVVGIQFAGTWDEMGNVLCVLTCSTSGGDQSYWSVTNEAPFGWFGLPAFGIDSDFAVEVDVAPGGAER